MDTGSASVDIFLQILENPLFRFTIRFLSSHHLKNGENYLKAALENFAGIKNYNFSLTESFFSKIVSTAIGIGCIAFNVKRESVRETMKIPYFRKGLLNVLTGIGRYGVTKPQKIPAPFLVVWNYTNACNLRCKHCYQRADKPLPEELTTEEKLAIVDQLDEANVATIAFSGGEPLMHKDLFKVAKYAADKGLYVSIATNGVLLTKETVRKLKESGVNYIEVSLDGATGETHDSFRGVQGCFNIAIQGIKNSVEAGIFTCIATTATSYNLHEIPKIIELAKKLGVRRVIVFNFIPTGRGKEAIHLDLTPLEREKLLRYLYTMLVKGEVEVLCTAPQYSRVCLEQSFISGRDILSPTHFASLNFHGRAKRISDFLGGCGAGRLYCAIQPNGLVTPCVFMPIVVGDLRKQKLQEIWLNSKVLNDLRNRNRLKGRCSHCRYRNICGGCRARAYAYYGDYLMPDPGCIRELEEPSTFLLAAKQNR